MFRRAQQKIFFSPNEIFALSSEDILANDWLSLDEQWKDLDDFSQQYRLSSFGNLFTVRLKKLMTPKLTRLGYQEVTLREKNGRQKSYLIHLLVAKYFLNHAKNDLVINHIDGIKTNNKLSNLEIVSRSRNSQHAFELGLNVARRGEASNLCKLTTSQVEEIRKLVNAGNSQKDVAATFATSQSNISRICTQSTRKYG